MYINFVSGFLCGICATVWFVNLVRYYKEKKRRLKFDAKFTPNTRY